MGKKTGDSIFAPQFKADPFPFLARLRAEQPVYRATLPNGVPVWLLTRYDDLTRLLRDERFAKSRYNALTPEQLRKQPWIPPMFQPLVRNMHDSDPPDHTRLRALVQKAFTPRLAEEMRERIQALADRLLDAAAARGEIDLIRDYALPIPMTIITEIMGVPERDRHRFHKWSRVIVSADAFSPSARVLPSLWSLTRYLRQFLKLRRAEPRDDLASALIQAEEGGERLTEDELLGMTFLLLVAGHETTVDLIGNGLLALLQHPEQRERLRRDPALIRPGVEELLRYTAPVFLSTERYAREPVSLHHVTIPRGGLTLGVIGSANRDEAVFEEGETLDVTRENTRHLGFGHGIHFCMGAPLARLESQIAINSLLQRFPVLCLKGAAERLRWRPSLVLRGLESLPVVFQAPRQ
jgi:cytochrome P450 PksS